MIPTSIASRLAVCSESELDVLWLAFSDLLDGIEKGRTYGREPGRDGRDYVAEAQAEIRDCLLYLAMARVRSAASAFVPWPDNAPRQYNGSGEPCDMWTGPCSCGATHKDGK